MPLPNRLKLLRFFSSPQFNIINLMRTPPKVIHSSSTSITYSERTERTWGPACNLLISFGKIRTTRNERKCLIYKKKQIPLSYWFYWVFSIPAKLLIYKGKIFSIVFKHLYTIVKPTHAPHTVSYWCTYTIHYSELHIERDIELYTISYWYL